MKTVSILLLFLTATLVSPLGFSGVFADDKSNDANETKSDTNQTETTNQTNSAVPENIGRQISSFVHNATALFQQQRNETIQAIKECHEKMQNATSDDRSQLIDECQATMNAIREKYQDARKQFQDLFKQFRENIIVLRHDAEGQEVSEQDKEKAMKNIDDDAAKHGITGIKMALEKMKGMGEKADKGIEKTIQHTNETSEYENQSGTSSMPEESQKDMRGPPSSPGKSDSHGKQ